MPKAWNLRDMAKRFMAAEAEPLRHSVILFFQRRIDLLAQIYNTQHNIFASNAGTSSVGLDSDAWQYKTYSN